jgi:aspartate kinase
MDLTRERCQARLLSILDRGIVPVITGFIGATAEGVVTTLGRGGSDYSATILGTALDADEIIIWTDVDGVMTADPRLVPGACTIPEISYLEATALAHFGAKVLHPKALRPVMASEIPVWIRNTFAPERPGTKITPAGPSSNVGVKALTALDGVALITVGGPHVESVSDILSRTFASGRADVLSISQSSSQNDFRFVVASALASRTVEALRREFAQQLVHEKVEHINLDPAVAIITVVGRSMGCISGVVARTLGALDRQNVNVIAITSSQGNISIVVAQRDMKTALITAHREFQLSALNSEALSERTA